MFNKYFSNQGKRPPSLTKFKTPQQPIRVPHPRQNPRPISIKANVTRLITYFNTHPDAEIDEIQNRKAKLEEAYEAFSKAQLQIEIVAEKENQTNMDHETQRSQFDDQYFACAKLISMRLREINSVELPVARTSNLASHSSSPITIKQTNNLLPKIEIRPYDGNLVNWYSFHDTFKNLVHDNDELIPVHKFYLLQNALQGPLTSITENLNASEENYLVAWNTLKQRCNKPRQIIQTHLQLLLELPEIYRETPANLRSLVEKAQVYINALKALNQPVDQWDALLVYIIVKKLDKGTRRVWERTLEDEEMPAFKQLLKFLGKQARGDELDTICFDANKSNTQHNNYNSKMPYKKRANHIQSHVGTQVQIQCPICGQNHAIYTCSKFLQTNEKGRFELARKAKLCLNCLKNNHQTSKCYLSGCKKCNYKHNTLLHFNETHKARNQNSINNTVESNIQNREEQPPVNLVVSSESEVLLRTAYIKILDKDKNEFPCRVLLDGGSQTHFITERLADRLRLDKTRIDSPFSGLGQNLTKAQYTVKTTIKSRTTPFSCDLTLVALPNITGLLPSRKIDKDNLSIPKNIALADPNFHKSAKIEALLGNTLFYQLLSVGQIKLCNNSVILQKTRLGWIVIGEVNLYNNQSNKKKTCLLTTNLEKQISKFWEIEELPNKKHLSSEELACETHFIQNIDRNTNGRYTVRLPFNEKRDGIGESHRMALKRFYSLEKRLESSPELKKQYSAFLKEYIELKHMTDITNADDLHIGYYLPHHA
ncbi:uncharacterized protein LOC122404087, partial [Colletes gigas]|uniref:uncharacterized protein LOC122404087 n=1 Tax=Colletes gigas TaxID=935657 RepID=UPI001C9B0640